MQHPEPSGLQAIRFRPEPGTCPWHVVLLWFGEDSMFIHGGAGYDRG